MDLALYAHVLSKHRRILIVGAGLAVLLALLSYYRVDMGVPPKLTPRKAEIWQSSASVLLTQRRQVVPVPGVSDPGSLAGVVGLYARLATSDEVLRLTKGVVAPGTFQAASSLDRNSESVLPVVTLFGTGTTPERARAIVASGMAAFLSYVKTQQVGVGARSRVDLRVLNSPQPAELLEPRKKTLPIVVFLSVLIAAMALAFVLENRNRVPASADVEPASRPREEVELRPASPPQGAEPIEDIAESEVHAASVRRWA